jgi:hypothetical protein
LSKRSERQGGWSPKVTGGIKSVRHTGEDRYPEQKPDCLFSGGMTIFHPHPSRQVGTPLKGEGASLGLIPLPGIHRCLEGNQAHICATSWIFWGAPRPLSFPLAMGERLSCRSSSCDRGDTQLLLPLPRGGWEGSEKSRTPPGPLFGKEGGEGVGWVLTHQHFASNILPETE